jgi:hypothetical protein
MTSSRGNNSLLFGRVMDNNFSITLPESADLGLSIDLP